jgi:hypothetical protein
VARTADEAIELLATGNVEAISLDHDLGDVRQDPYPREVTGMAVVLWMLEHKVFPQVINVHSHNSVASHNMIKRLVYAVSPAAAFDPKHIVCRWMYAPDVAAELETLLWSLQGDALLEGK